MKLPYVGADVLYVLPDGRSKGDIRPAKIVRVWGDGEPYPVQLVVFFDGTNDYPTESAVTMWRTSVPYSLEFKEGRWSWGDE